MTTNEQIIIDGVDVSGCSGFSNNPEDVKTGQTCWYYTEYVHDNEWGTRCPEHPNCEYKQLQRKTAECEELKKKFSKFFNIDNQECWDIAFLKDENARYKQALDEIEKKIKEINGSDILIVPDLSLQENAKAIMRQCNKGYREILDIISEAKGANVENT